jgi:hypothetical protein
MITSDYNWGQTRDVIACDDIAGLTPVVILLALPSSRAHSRRTSS